MVPLVLTCLENDVNPGEDDYAGIFTGMFLHPFKRSMRGRSLVYSSPWVGKLMS